MAKPITDALTTEELAKLSDSLARVGELVKPLADVFRAEVARVGQRR